MNTAARQPAGRAQASVAAAIRLHAADNVVVAGRALSIGTVLEGENITCRNEIASGHKIAAAAITKGELVRKYNQVIGVTSAPIAPGEHVHTHNCVMASFERDYAFGTEARPTEFVPAAERATFMGFARPDGRVGTRNYVAVMTTVNCSATVARMIAKAFDGDALRAFPNIDGVVAFTHGTGCGMGTTGEGFDQLQRIMWGYMRQPNIGGVLIVGLGCEANQIRFLLDMYGLKEGPTFQFYNIQDAGGTRAAVERGIEHVRAMLPHTNAISRTSVSAEHLMLALQCGGSDGYSGITANPSLGAAADLLVRHGGSVLLSETPEIYGAEHLLTRRAASPAVGEALIARIRWWEDYTARNGGEMNNNPTPGNRAGGLTTILEKSLGAAAKGGTTNLVDVCLYGAPPKAKGFVFMDSPGYDPVSITGQVATGATIVCFTTGRGSVYGCKPSPSLKLATNTPMYERMSEDMDINCGEVLSHGVPVAEMGERIFKRILAVASGERSKSEALGFGDNEFNPWVLGAVM